MTHRLHVAHVTALPSAGGRSPVGGVGTYSASLATLLARADLRQSILCNRDADRERFASQPPVRLVPAWNFDALSVPWSVGRAAARLHPGVVHVQHELFLYGRGPRALLFPVMLERLQRRHRVVVTVHGVTTAREIDEGLLAGRRSPIPLPVLRRVIVGIFRRIARSRAHLVVHSDVLRERLVELGANSSDVSVIPHLLFDVDDRLRRISRAEARAKLGLPQQARIALTWGYWNGYKGLDVLVNGFAGYQKRDRSALLLLGTGPHPQMHGDAAYRSAYDAEMQRLSGGEGVRHVGFIDDARLPEYVAAADVCIFAYTKHLAASGPATYAITLGAPILLSSVFAEAPESIRFDPTPSSLSSALERFFRDPEANRIAAEQLRSNAGDASILSAYRDLYAALAAPAGGSG